MSPYRAAATPSPTLPTIDDAAEVRAIMPTKRSRRYRKLLRRAKKAARMNHTAIWFKVSDCWSVSADVQAAEMLAVEARAHGFAVEISYDETVLKITWEIEEP